MAYSCNYRDFQDRLGANLTCDLLNGPGVNSWPITKYNYAIVRTKSYPDCTKVKILWRGALGLPAIGGPKRSFIQAGTLLDFLAWTQTSSQAEGIARALGFSLTPTSVRQRILLALADVTCQGMPVRPCTLPWHVLI